MRQLKKMTLMLMLMLSGTAVVEDAGVHWACSLGVVDAVCWDSTRFALIKGSHQQQQRAIVQEDNRRTHTLHPSHPS